MTGLHRREGVQSGTLAAVLRSVLAAAIPVLIGVYAAAPVSAFRTLPSLWLALALAALLYGVLLTLDGRSAPLDLLIVGVVTVFFLVRVPVLWLAPGQFIYPWFREPWFPVVQADLPRALLFLIAGTAATVAGFRLGLGWRRSTSAVLGGSPPRLAVSAARLLAVGIAYFTVDTLQWVYLGTASSALDGAAANGGLLFMRHFVSMYAAVAIGLTAGLDQWHQSTRAHRLQLCAFVGLFLLYTIAGGSRAGLMTLIALVTLYLLIRHGNFRVGWRLPAMGAAALAAAVVLFPAITAVRFAWLDGRFAVDVHRQGAYRSWWSAGIMGGFNRVNGLDPLLVIVARKEIRPLAEFVDARLVFKSAVNLVVPSALLGRDPFPGVLPMSRAFSAVYRGHDRGYIDSHYQTDMWTFWGSAFALGGWAYGPWLMLAIAMGLGAGYRRIEGAGARFGVLWRLWWLYGCYHVLISYGFDVDFAASLSLLAGGAVAALLSGVHVPAAAAQLQPATAQHVDVDSELWIHEGGPRHG